MARNKDALHAQVDTTLTNFTRASWDQKKAPTIEVYLDQISAELKVFGHNLVDVAPESRELSLALTKLQELRMYAVAAVVLHQDRLEL